MLNSPSYSAAHTIFRVFETLGWVIVTLGTLLAVIGLASGNFPIFPRIEDPTLSDRLVAMIPGILIAEAGLIHIALVKVGQANVDTAEMTREILRITKQGQQVALNSPAPAHRPAPKTPPRTSAPIPEISATQGIEDTLVEIYRGVEIHQPNKQYRGHTVGSEYFISLEAAKRHIDSATKPAKPSIKPLSIKDFGDKFVVGGREFKMFSEAQRYLNSLVDKT